MNSTTFEELVRRGDWTALRDAASNRVRIEPRDAEAWRSLSRAAWETGRHGDALAAWRHVLALSGHTAPNLVTMGRIALHALAFDEARAAFDDAERLTPDAPELLAARATLLIYEGRFDAAEQVCRRCLALRPDYVPAYTALGRLNNGRFSDEELSLLSRIATQAGAPADYRIPAAYALAHGFEARDELPRAFAALQYAHDLSLDRNRREGRVPDRAGVEARASRLRSLFGSVPSPGGVAPGSPVPVFIVGMPRSGTTLIESVLAAHSRVRALGERPAMPHLLAQCLAWSGDTPAPWADEAVSGRWRESYLAGVAAGTDHFTDKHPLNFEAVGLILHLFPEARIIHVRRNPMETCLSIYRNEFSKFWTFTDRLEDLGHYYAEYARQMAHWDRLPGNRVYTVQYEAFAADLAREAPRLVSACGLEWEAQCLRFQEVVRVIPTFSAVSARAEVRVHRGAAERYREFLTPLRAALESAGVDPETGSLRATPALQV